MEYSFNLAKEFCNLYNSQGRNLFALIENVTNRMLEHEDNIFFSDQLSDKIHIDYEPTIRAETSLPFEVFDYFMDAPESTTPAFYRDAQYVDVDDHGAPVESEPKLDFTHDIGELLLVLTNNIKL